MCTLYPRVEKYMKKKRLSEKDIVFVTVRFSFHIDIYIIYERKEKSKERNERNFEIFLSMKGIRSLLIGLNKSIRFVFVRFLCLRTNLFFQTKNIDRFRIIFFIRCICLQLNIFIE